MKVQPKFLNCISLMLGIAMVLSWVFPVAGSAEDSDLTTFGDIMQIALLAAGPAGTFIANDPEGVNGQRRVLSGLLKNK